MQGKLATSIPFRAPSDESTTLPSSASSASSSASSTLALQATGTKGECPNCRAALTPMRPHLTLHFEKLLQKKNAAKGTNSRKRVKPQYYGEALTSDKVFKRLRAHKESQKQPSKKKQRKSPSPVTEEAGSSPAANESEMDEGNKI